MEAELAFAGDVATRAADISMATFGSNQAVTTKSDRTPVTETDLAIEAMFRRAVWAAFPDDGVVGEEEGGRLGAGRTWIVDPIDGTVNFARGQPAWATLIALAVDGEPVLGVADAPAIGERYQAVRGAGARLNGVPIRVSGTARLEDATIGHTGTESWTGHHLETAVRSILATAARTDLFHDVSGHTSLARGAADVAIEPLTGIWDWAAPKVIVEEAGGRMSALDGEPPRHQSGIVSTNGVLHEEVLSRLR
jgi:histidinol-phosphatase